MKLRTLTSAAMIALMGAIAPSLVYSQPSSTGNYESGYWQPTAAVDHTQFIRVELFNQSGADVYYDSIYGPNMGSVLPPGGTAIVSVPPINEPSEIANIHIYSSNGSLLVFDYGTSVNNTVTVRVRNTQLVGGENAETIVGATDVDAKYDTTVYIDEAGRVYSF